MLCGVCRNALEGLSDPVKIPRLARVPQLEIETYIYAHHPSLESLKQSYSHGCVVCCSIPRAQRSVIFGTGGDIRYEYGYMSTFRVTVESEGEVVMHVKYNGLEEIPNRLVHVPGGGEENVVYDLDERTDGPRAWRQLESWVEDCGTHHDCLAQQSATDFLPSRLLRVGGTDEARMYNIVQRDECPQGTKYMALSYVWGIGPVNQTLRLLHSNIEDLRRPNPVSNLPRTFRDAIRVALHFGIQHLWIDRLCIIQDSQEDWRREANMMHSVYTSSYLTISALSGINDNSGLFYARDVPSVAPTTLSLSLESEKQPSSFRHAHDPDHTRIKTWESDAVTSHRGWCYQERVLSPRAVHFGAHQLYWECRHRLACEIQPLSAVTPLKNARFKRLLVGPTPPEPEDPYLALLAHWYRTVQMYTPTKFTFSSDRLIALAGFKEEMRKALQVERPGVEHEYVEGMWREDLRFGLCWFRFLFEGQERDERPEERVFPTWSWAHVNNATTYENRGFEVGWLVGEDACVVDAGGAEGGSVLRVTGRWAKLRVCVQVSEKYLQAKRAKNDRPVLHACHPHMNEVCAFPPHEGPENGVAFDFLGDAWENIFCMPVMACAQRNGGWEVEGLCFVNDNGGEVGDGKLYRRVGLASMTFPTAGAARAFFEKFPEESIVVR